MLRVASVLLFIFNAVSASAADKAGDSHYTAAGFFDIHVCNWPDRPQFYLALLSTERFNEIESVVITDTTGSIVGQIGLNKYRTIKRKHKPEKRAFISHIEVPGDIADGWFEADVVLKNGEHYTARDYVTHELLGRATGHVPPHRAELSEIPASLGWDGVAGAGFYQVFIRDAWNDDKLIYSSKLIRQNHIELPAGLLQQGGYYSWKVHARDVNEDRKLGDFNLGSQSEWVEFSVD